MDSLDVFRKLSAGAKFTHTKKNQTANGSQWGNKKGTKHVSAAESVKHKKSEENKKQVAPEGTEIKLLGSISAGGDGNIVKSSKKKERKRTKAKKAALEQERLARMRNLHRITIFGNNVPEPAETFEQLQQYGISEKLIQQLHQSGYTTPTPIQMQAIPVMLQGRQVLACAPTGSGKTVAFLLPIVHDLKGPRRKGFRAVVVSPTRELAKQTYRECLRLADVCKLNVHIITKVRHAVNKFGSQSGQKFDILITTPNRLVYLLKQDPPVISLNNVEWLVVDESDKLFEVGQNGFRDQLAVIYQACNTDSVKRAMFSATHTPDVARWARKNLKGLVSITVGHRNTAADLVQQELMFVGSESGKLIAFRDLIQKGLSPPVLVFVQTKERAKELFKELIYDGINVEVIHADRTQLQRDNVVRSFREGNIWVLICTELMGRGIDFKGVNLVVNYDFPPSAISYIHRIGRTGRAGRPGKAITFFTEDDTVSLRSIAHVIRDSGCEVPEYLFSLKKASKRARRKLEQRAPKREPIFTEPKFQKQEKEHMRNIIEKPKKRKRNPEKQSNHPGPKKKKISSGAFV